MHSSEEKDVIPFANEVSKALYQSRDVTKLMNTIDNVFILYAVIRFVSACFLSQAKASQFDFKAFTEIVAASARIYDHSSELFDHIKAYIQKETGDRQAAVALLLA